MTDHPPIISLKLTPEQTEALRPVLERQRGRQEGAILSVVDSHIDAKLGHSSVKLSVAFVPWRSAVKLAKEITKAAAPDHPAAINTPCKSH